MKKAFLFFILVAIWFVLLFPKDFVWNYGVKELKKNGIEVSAKEVNMALFILYNKIDIKDLIILKSFKIDNIHVKHSIKKPLKVLFGGLSQYGDFFGEISLDKREGFVTFPKSNLNGAFFRSYFKKTKDGMRYEFTY